MGKRKRAISGVRYTYNEIMGNSSSSKSNNNEKMQIRANSSISAFQFELCSLSYLPLKIDGSEDIYIDHNGYAYSKEAIDKYIISNTQNPFDDSQKFSYEYLKKAIFTINDKNQLIDPVTSDLLSTRSTIVINFKTGYVYDYQSIVNFNKKTNLWKDLMTGENFNESDIITIHDPQRQLSLPFEPIISFKKEIQETEAQRKARLLLGTFDSSLSSSIPKEDKTWALARTSPESFMLATNIASNPPKENTIITIHTSNGNIVCELNSQNAPLGTINILGHALRGSYVKCSVSHIDQGKSFEINPFLLNDETVWGTPISYEKNEQSRGKRYQIYLVNTGNPQIKIINTARIGISREPLPIDKFHVVGYVIEGEGIASHIIDGQIYPNGKPVNPTLINNITIERNPFPIS